MEELKYLVEIINRDKVKKVEVINNENRAKDRSKVNALYDSLLQNKFSSEEEAAEFFFPNSNNKQKNFSNLKGQLRERLINTIFFIDVKKPSFQEIQRAYYTCYKNIAAVQILLGRFARTPAINLAQKTLNQATKFEFTDIALELSRILRTHSGMIGNKKKFKEYNALVKKFERHYISELLAEEYYMDLASEVSNTKSFQADLLKKAKLYFKELDKKNKKNQTQKFIYLAYLVFTLRFELENDYNSTLLYCEKAISQLSTEKHLYAPNRISSFLLRKLSCHIQLKQFKEAELTIQKCLTIVPEGVRNWYIILDYQFRLALFTKKFQNAYQIYNEAINHPGFRQQHSNITEHWKMHEAFIFYLIYTGKISPDKDNPTKKFRISKFLNEVPLYSKDKRGSNITIIILQILFLLHEKKYDAIIDRMESLKMYVHRYLRKDDTFRSSCFIKMLMQLPAASFHKAGVIRKTKKFRERLEEVPLEIANQRAELEIVPYEMLWEFVLEELDHKFH